MNAQTALEFILKDEELLLDILYNIDMIKSNQRSFLNDVIERYLVSELADEKGYIKPGIIKEDLWNTIETELLSIFTPSALENTFLSIITEFNRRLVTIDQLMIDLELDNAVYGNTLFEIEAIQQRSNDIASGLVRGAYGEGDYTGSIKRVQDSILRYKLDTEKPEFVLRSELMDTLVKDAGAGVNHANSVAITATMTVDRDLRRGQALKGGVNHGLYSGPFDGVIREFCDGYLGKVELYTFWDTLSNDMPPGLFDTPVSIYCGGINCRHRIVPWKLEWSDGKTDLRERFALANRDMNKRLILKYGIKAFELFKN